MNVSQPTRKSIAVLSTVALSVFTTIVLLTPPATRYESSVLQPYPFFVWLAFGTGIVGGLVLIIIEKPNYTRSKWSIGLALILWAYGVFFSLPLVRGYKFYGTPLSDGLYHLGIVADIVSTGVVPDTIYPATHVLISHLILITDLSGTILRPLLSYFFAILLVIGIFISGRRLLPITCGRYVLAAAVPLVYTSVYMAILPWFYALCMLPLLLFITRFYQFEQRFPSAVLVFILGISIVLYHPLTAVFATLTLIIYVVATWFITREQIGHVPAFAAASVIGTATTVWILSRDRTQLLLSRVVAGTYSDAGVATYTGRAAESGYTMAQLVWEFIINEWGALFLYMSVVIFIIGGIAYRTVFHRATWAEVMLTIQFISGILLGAMFVVFRLFSSNPVRVSQYGLFYSLYLIGIGLWLLLHHRSRYSNITLSTVSATVLIIVVVTTALLSASLAYDSNRHLTHSTVTGTEWHLEYHNRTIQTKSLRMSNNIEIYLTGFIEASETSRTFSRYESQYQLPKHLGYDDNSTVAETFEKSVYLITKQDDLVWLASQPQNRQQELLHYTSADQKRLTRDQAAAKVYSNGGYMIWLANRQ